MKFERIVIAIDFSERSIAAAQWVTRHFAPKAQILLVHVLEIAPPPRFVRTRASAREGDIESYRAVARAQLHQLGAYIGRGRIAEEEVRVGQAHEEVLRAARAYGADLVVVGSHRDRETFWNRLGTTAERVIGGSRVPVLVVHGAPREVPRMLLAAVDDSETAARVIQVSHTLAKQFRARGAVVHVLPPHAMEQLFPASEGTASDYRLVQEEQQLVHATQEWLATQLSTAPDELTSTVLVGEPAESILSEALTTGAELLVIGRERKSSVRRFLLGGVASAVTRVANCPVLVIPGGTPVDRASGREDAPATAHAEDSTFAGFVP
jgi:nucleotide-binding universal stress UspA family protein